MNPAPKPASGLASTLAPRFALSLDLPSGPAFGLVLGLVSALVFALLGPTPAHAYQGAIEIASHYPNSPAGGNGNSREAVMSWDGRYVVFQSDAFNLIVNDHNGSYVDIFEWDRETKKVRPISIAVPGDPDSGTGNLNSDHPNISSDGRFIVFDSHSTNYPGATPGYCQSYIWDRETELIELVSAADESSGAGNGRCQGGGPDVSDDGRWVVFASTSSDLVDGDHGNPPPLMPAHQIFVRDRLRYRTYRLTPTGDSEHPQPNDKSSQPAISDNGRWVVYGSHATNIPNADGEGDLDIFFWEVGDGGVKPGLKIDTDGGDFSQERSLAISADGSAIAFTTSSQLVDGDNDGLRDAYAWRNSQLTLVSGGISGHARYASIDARGQIVAFTSSPKVYTVNLDTFETTQHVQRWNGTPATGGAYDSWVSGDGRAVAFSSHDTGLVPGDNNPSSVADVFSRGDVLDFIDARERRDDQGGIDTEPQTWADRGLREVNAVVADGVTPVIVRFEAGDTPGPVLFRLKDELGGPVDVGVLSSLSAWAAGTPERDPLLLVNTVQFGPRHVAFAIYEPPQDFVRIQTAFELPDDTDERERTVEIETTFGTDVYETPFALLRPPVVLMHGIKSSRDTWSLPLASDSRFEIYRHDYEPTNAETFLVNLAEPVRAANHALAALRAKRVAVTQVDYIGHSMGGILGRVFVGRPPGYPDYPAYLHRDNFGYGYFHKFVTLGTPHRGASLAECLVEARDLPWVEQVVEALLGDWGAVEDLAVSSSVNLSLPDAEVTSHAVVGRGGRTAIDIVELLGWFDDFFEPLSIFASVTEDLLFPNDAGHDLVVAAASQEARLLPLHTTPLFFLSPFNPAIHLTETKEDQASDALIDLLNASVGPLLFADKFAERDPADIDPSEQLDPLRLACSLGTTIVGGQQLVITAPGATQPGGPVTVSVDTSALGLVQFDKVAVVSRLGTVIVDNTAPVVQATFDVPLEEYGPVEVNAFVLTDTKFYTGPSASFDVIAFAQLDELLIEPDSVRLVRTAPAFRPVVYGFFSDGAQRRLGGEPALEFASTDPLVFSVDSTGALTGHNPGLAVLEVSTDGVTATASVTVLEGRLELVQVTEEIRSGRRIAYEYSLLASGALANESIDFYQGFGSGPSAVPGCPGLSFEFATPIFLGSATANAEGVAELSIQAPDPIDFQYHAVEPGNCALSNLEFFNYP